jgi:hypothetical protein
LSPLTSTEYATKLFAQLDTLEHRYRRFMHWALTAIAILFASTLWMLFVALPRKTDEIQRSRAAAVIDTCRDQNVRHDRTIARLRILIARLPDGRQRTEAERNIASTIALIDALAPRQDCAALARKRVGTPPR